MKKPCPLFPWCLVCLSGLGQATLFGRGALVKRPVDLQRALNAARPGDIVTLKNGYWKDAVVSIEKGGSSTKPLETSAESPAGVAFTGASPLVINAPYVTGDGLHSHSIEGIHSRAPNIRGGDELQESRRHFIRLSKCWKTLRLAEGRPRIFRNHPVQTPMKVSVFQALMPTLWIFALLILPGINVNAADVPKKPNIIFILGDDVGMGDIGCTGSDNYKTPNIDALAAGGTRFSHAYTVSLCGPSRATILTGRYLFRTGATNQDAVGRIKPTDEVLTPSVLKTAGYVCSAIGKWSQFSLTPRDFGFDDYLTFKGSGIYWNTQAKGKEYWVNGKTLPLQDKQYMPELMHNHLVDFITRHRDDPFYIYYSISHIHTDILATPDSAPDSKNLYKDNITYMDKLVGKLVAELERQKLRENTLVIYFGDNGTTNGQAPTSTVGGRRLLGAKGSMQDGGNRVPMVVNWPGTVPADKVSEDLIDSSDFHPTFAELTGAKLPGNVIIDGQSFAARLRSGKGKPRESIFIQLARSWYVLERGWKLNQAGELFDMTGAPWEEALVAADTLNPAAQAARRRLQTALDLLNPAGGHLDTGDPSGRHASNIEKRNKKKDTSKDEPSY